MSGYQLKIAVFEATESVCPKISDGRRRPAPTILCVGKLDEMTFHMVKISIPISFFPQLHHLTHVLYEHMSLSFPADKIW